MNLGEFDLIDEIKKRFPLPAGVLGIGDDCAILPQQPDRETLVSTDMLIDGVHFLLDVADPFDLGWKSAAVNISDIAGMGGRPDGIFLSFALPKSLGDDWLLRFIDGFKELCDRFCCPLLGGDTTSSLDRLCISVTVVGSAVAASASVPPASVPPASVPPASVPPAAVPSAAVPSASVPPASVPPASVQYYSPRPGTARKRSDARPGDLICVTGPLGDSAAGLQLILKNVGGPRSLSCNSVGGPRLNNASKSEQEKYLIDRHYRPVPQVEKGLVLSATEGVHAMMDISDGIASDLRHILRASNVSAVVDIKQLPMSNQLLSLCESMEPDADTWDPVRLAAEGGEDYELLFTATLEAVELLKSNGVSIYPIGWILPIESNCDIQNRNIVPTLTWLNSERDYLGFRHF